MFERRSKELPSKGNYLLTKDGLMRSIIDPQNHKIIIKYLVRFDLNVIAYNPALATKRASFLNLIIFLKTKLRIKNNRVLSTNIIEKKSLFLTEPVFNKDTNVMRLY